MTLGINTTSIVLPNEVSNEIMQKLQEGSAVMRLAQKVDLPSRGLTIPVIMGDPIPAIIANTLDVLKKKLEAESKKENE